MKKSCRILGGLPWQWKKCTECKLKMEQLGDYRSRKRAATVLVGGTAHLLCCVPEGCIRKARGILVRPSRGSVYIPWIGEFCLQLDQPLACAYSWQAVIYLYLFRCICIIQTQNMSKYLYLSTTQFFQTCHEFFLMLWQNSVIISQLSLFF